MAESNANGGAETQKRSAAGLDAAPVGAGIQLLRGVGALLLGRACHPHQHRRRGWGDELLTPVTVRNVAEKYGKAVFDQG